MIDKERTERDRLHLNEYNEALAEYEIVYKNIIETYFYMDDEDLEEFVFEDFKDEMNSVLKKLVVLKTKSILIADIFIDTDIYIPTSDILHARITHHEDPLELYEKAVKIFDENMIELRSKVTEAYDKLD